MCDLRARKSPAEIAVIRNAYRLAAAGLDAAVAAIGPGVTERAVAAEAEAAMRRQGAEGTGIDTIVGSGPNARPILARATFREIERDDLVVLTMAPRYRGYHGAIGRPVFVGEPAREAMAAFDAARRAQEACRALLGPGIEGSTVEAAGRHVMEDAGLGRTSSTRASTASASSSSSRRSSAPAARPCSKRAWWSRSTFLSSTRRGAACGWRTASF